MADRVGQIISSRTTCGRTCTRRTSSSALTTRRSASCRARGGLCSACAYPPGTCRTCAQAHRGCVAQAPGAEAHGGPGGQPARPRAAREDPYRLGRDVDEGGVSHLSYISKGLIKWEQYKSVAKYQHKLVPYLQELTERQIEKGLIKYVSFSQ